MSNNPKDTRKCVACSKRNDKSLMIRFAKTTEGIIIDKTGKMDCRGAYVHNDKKCIDILIKKRKLNKAFKAEIQSSVYEELEYGR